MNSFIYHIFRVFPYCRTLFYKYWNRMYFYLIGIEFGRNMRIQNRIYVVGKGNVIIGDDFHFTSGDCINAICRNIRGVFYTPSKDAIIEIGDRVGMSSTCLWAKERITIGNDVNIGGDCLIMDNDAHPIDYMQRRMDFMESVGKEAYYTTIGTEPIEIDDDVWIGARCQILKGVHIGARSIIAAGSVVTHDIPCDVIAGGIPCEIIRSIKE